MAERIDGHTLLIGLMAYPIRHSMSQLCITMLLLN